jgi:DNA-directed RNA polymerase specialized sigma24 family protein
MAQPITTNRDEQQFEAIYELHFPALMEMAVVRFSLSESDARQLAHDALIASIHSAPRIVDMRSWLVGAVISGVTRSRGSHS